MSKSHFQTVDIYNLLLSESKFTTPKYPMQEVCVFIGDDEDKRLANVLLLKEGSPALSAAD